MAIPSGLSAQLGVAEEVTYGTPVTVTRFYEFVPPETLKLDISRVQSKGLRAGARVLRSDRWAPGKRSAGGNLTFELGTKSFGLWFKHMLGGVATTQPDAIGAPTVYRHTFTPGDLPVGLTTQVGKPDVGGVVNALTYTGCRVKDWELAAAVDDIVTLNVGIIARDEDTAPSLAVVSYPTAVSLLTFVSGTMTIGGGAANIKKVSVKGGTGLDDNRFFLGSALRSVPLENAWRQFSGTLDTEFESMTAYNRYRNGTEADIVLEFTGPTISGGFKYGVKVTIHCRFDGETPSVAGPDVLQLGLPFVAVDDSTTSIKIEYTTTDTLP